MCIRDSRTRDRIIRLHELALDVARRRRMHVIDALSISEGWPSATADNRHYDGGVMRFYHRHDPLAVRKQTVTLALLNELLNRLRMLAIADRRRGGYRER